MALLAAVLAAEAVPRWPRRSPSYKPAYSAPAAYAEPAYPVYKAPEYKVPEYKAPEYKAPEYKAPEYKAPEYKAPAYSKPAYGDDYAKPSYDYVRWYTNTISGMITM